MLLTVTALFLLLLFIICLYIVLYQRYSRFFKLLNEFPGPKMPFIIGDLIKMGHSEKLFIVETVRALEYYPVYRQTIFTHGAINILNPKDVEIVLTSLKHLDKSKPYHFLQSWLKTGLLTSTGSKWQFRRKLLTPAFHFNILREFIHIFNSSTDHFMENIKSLKDKPYIDVNPLIVTLTLSSIMETSMGTKLNVTGTSYINYKDAIHNFGQLFVHRIGRPFLYEDSIYRLTPYYYQRTNILKTLNQFTEKVISEKKKNTISYCEKKRAAFLDLLLKMKAEGGNIDDAGIKEEVDTFMFEGHDTTASALSFILLTLANLESFQDNIRKEIIEVLGETASPTYLDLQQLPYTEMCIKECLRLFPSVPTIGRNASEELKLATGYTIPKGCMIHIQVFHIHRNPNLYPDPLTFNPDRFLSENVKNRHPFAYIPFSAGHRNCIGQKFAMLELKAVLCGLLRNYYLKPVTKLDDFVFIKDMILRTTNPHYIKFEPRVMA